MQLTHREGRWLVFGQVLSLLAMLAALVLVLQATTRLRDLERRVHDLEVIRDGGKHLVPPKPN